MTGVSKSGDCDFEKGKKRHPPYGECQKYGKIKLVSLFVFFKLHLQHYPADQTIQYTIVI